MGQIEIATFTNPRTARLAKTVHITLWNSGHAEPVLRCFERGIGGSGEYKVELCEPEHLAHPRGFDVKRKTPAYTGANLA